MSLAAHEQASHRTAVANVWDTAAARMRWHSVLLSASAGLTGVVSYACTVFMTHLLPSAQFTEFAAEQMLLGIVGLVSNALVPLPLADAVRRFPRRSEQRRSGVAFAVLVSLVLGVASGVVAGAIAAMFAPSGVVAAVAVSSVVLFAVTTSLCWLQGEERFAHHAVLSVVEVAVRLGFTLFALRQGWGAGGALLGFAVGAAVLLAVPSALFADLAWRPTVLTDRARWSETGSIALTQLVVAVLVAADVILVALVGDGSAGVAAFQALSTLAKGPVYIAAGTVLVVFPLLRAGGGQVEHVLDAALRSFARLALLAAVVLGTMPSALVLLGLPDWYASSLPLLPWLALAGLGYAVATVLTIVLLGLRAHYRNRLGLLAAAVLLPGGMAAGWRAGGAHGLAVGAAVGALAAVICLLVLSAPLLPRGTIRSLGRGAAVWLVVVALLVGANPYPLVWLAVAIATGMIITARRSGRSRPRKPRRGVRLERRRERC